MGTPFEGKRQMNDIQGFTTKEGVILPNDDLDLQLVWLMAVERLGITAVDARILGEFWHSYIGPHWNEYGIGKINMAAGLMPPLSGDAYNDWNNSNGAWIRTEVWATLAPACPDVAMKYAYEDACVDHGTKEGTTAAMFVAALESAAFVISDLRKLIELALAKIPEESRMAKSIVKVLECYDSGMDYREARNVIQQLNADIGNGWFEAPSNVSYAIIGLLWGEGDFKKSMIYAINCGDDTDCTGATVGSVLGIIGGTAIIPEDWKRHIGDDIVTISIKNGANMDLSEKKNSTLKYAIPATCTELTDRVTRIAPSVPIIFATNVSFTDGESEITEQEIKDLYTSHEAFSTNRGDNPISTDASKELFARQPYSFTVECAFMKATLSLDGDPDIKPCEEKNVHLRIVNDVLCYGNIPYNLRFRWLTADGFTVEGPKWARLLHRDAHSEAVTEIDFKLTAPESVDALNRVVLEITADGRPSTAYLPLVLLGK
jgi:hypothetical protein